MSDFQNKGYTVVRNAISSDMAALFAQYTLFANSQGRTITDTQVDGSKAAYADPLMESLLLYLQPVIEQNTGLQLFPTYSLYRIYSPGQVLAPHKDRPSCEISMTLCLGYDYKGSDYEYPIFVDGERFVLYPGDLVCYRGVDLTHWREEFKAPASSWHSQVFLHYVDANGPYADFKYDKRNHIG